MADRREFYYDVGDQIQTVSVEPDGEQFRVTIGERVYRVRALQPEPGQLVLEVDGRRLRAFVARDGPRRYVALDGHTWQLEATQAQRRRPGARTGAMAGLGSLEATMPGLVLEVRVAAGDQVARGDTLVVLEAMKMELQVSSPCDGQVRKVHCAAGEVVERGQLLVEVEEVND